MQEREDRSERFMWEPGDLVWPPCAYCQRWKGEGRCQAFPEGIPKEILQGEVSHEAPYPGDNGLQFKAAERRRQ